MNFREEPQEVELGFPLVSGKSIEALEEDHHARAHTDYETWKRDLMEWLAVEGKNPERLRGYADETLRQTNYKVDQIMRWLWNERGYTTELFPEDADALMKELGRYSEYKDSNLNTFIKAIKRIFAYYNHEKGKNIDWDCDVKLSEPKVTNRDYFKKHEFRTLYEASLEHGTVKNYHTCSVEERDQLKAHLAQRFEVPKSEITPEHFEKANSFKIPSLISVALDGGLRPVEVERAKVDWVDLREETLDIPKEESSKNTENWSVVLSNKSVRALEKWLDEQSHYEKYANSDALWLNNQGNPYNSNSLNYLLDQLIEECDIEPAGRDLSFYSIRHGTATIWADEENVQDAQEQLRHKKVETTLGYAHSGTESRHDKKNSKW